ncbi:hypothetical protein F5Y11DRAFT_363483 [Daldinia sp. FL1419]|nr:hypothetical protein F5Y11DRAFT_363483 [Daldinia sp. FL1419]
MSYQQIGGPASSQGPIIRNPETNCTAELGTGLIPVCFRHTNRCECVVPKTYEGRENLVYYLRLAAEAKSLELEKASTVFAWLLLGMSLSGEPMYKNGTGVDIENFDPSVVYNNACFLSLPVRSVLRLLSL